MRDEAANIQHARNPEVGDYWHEMFCPVMVVLDVTSLHVIICKKKKDVDRDHWTWDVSETKHLTREQFALEPHYSTAKMAHKFHCDVIPRGHADVAAAYAVQCCPQDIEDAPQ